MTNLLRLVLVAPWPVVIWACVTDRGPREPLPEFEDVER